MGRRNRGYTQCRFENGMTAEQREHIDSVWDIEAEYSMVWSGTCRHHATSHDTVYVLRILVFENVSGIVLFDCCACGLFVGCFRNDLLCSHKEGAHRIHFVYN